MRKVWYQNNQRFNPLFKIDKLNDGIKRSTSIDSRITETYENRVNPSNNQGKDGNFFSTVQNVKTNQ